MSLDETSQIKSVSSWDSGGGMELDLVELQDGQILAISEEVIILYKDMDDLTAGDATAERPTIYL